MLDAALTSRARVRGGILSVDRAAASLHLPAAAARAAGQRLRRACPAAVKPRSRLVAALPGRPLEGQEASGRAIRALRTRASRSDRKAGGGNNQHAP